MKLVRVGKVGAERPGIIDAEGNIRDISSIVDDIDGTALSSQSLAELSAMNLDDFPRLDGDRFGSCISGVGKIICVGLNYVDHASESGFVAPKEPVLFMKASTSLCGAFDNVEMPVGGEKLDYEVELGVVIGKTAKNVSVENAAAHIGGYCVFNDVSERAFQLEGTGQWLKGKSCDTFGPCGPWLVTPDEVKDISNLDLQLTVNGELRQTANTRDMIFGVPELISYISRFMTLQPGDLIASGTPAGVALGMKPPVYLKPGDTMELSIEGLGQQKQTIV
ncbi:fumarylacetoacetate hydrolase family protein [Spongiibacter sp. KMU-166]|uniref:Fumarylacetoacetate hydrolase family protein n=1 Tax=Spongiibacter thalassae TaxID=2721624 RepID=A0ABX1GHI3_9GAMM|nr:fumarylacetoacetate hydrolase family protein [Spongiibacter thalassae]NKI18680.1 fumarylacetoacetate hydrolase family protein [Spongiibacter thalassae]